MSTSGQGSSSDQPPKQEEKRCNVRNIMRCTMLCHQIGNNLTLNKRKITTLLPDLTKLKKTYNKIPQEEQTVFGSKVRYWVQKLNGLPRGTIEISEQESGRLRTDIANGFPELQRLLEEQPGTNHMQ